MPMIHVNETQNGKRLDHVLTDLMPLSRSQIQKQIKTGEITLNKKSCTPHTFLEIGDIIFYPHQTKKTQKKISLPNLEILFEDRDVIVIQKPAGLLVHRVSATDERPSIADMLVKKYRGLKNVGENPLRPGIVHRLDRDVSGVMIVAKTPSAFEYLKQAFQNRLVEKIYIALVYGVFPNDHGKMDWKISRSKSQGKMVARTGDQEGKEALTTWDVMERFKIATAVRVQIHTGRTHQIRVHFLASGHPVVGDKLYRKKTMRHIRELEIDRLFLHAESLSLTLPSGEKKTFTSPLPEELKSILIRLPKT